MDMNSQYGESHDEVTVPGFESPNSPAASYNNVSDFGDEARDPPPVPTHLQHTLLRHPPTKDSPSTLPLPRMSLSTTSTSKPRMANIQEWLSGSPTAFFQNSSLSCFIKQAVRVEVLATAADMVYHAHHIFQHLILPG